MVKNRRGMTLRFIWSKAGFVPAVTDLVSHDNLIDLRGSCTFAVISGTGLVEEEENE